MRLFVGIPLPEDVTQRLSMLAGGIPGARWVAPDNYHITLRFLGETDGGQAEDLIGDLSRLRVAPVPIRIDGLGLFGERRRQRMLYADVVADPGLSHLNQKIEQIAQRAGYAPERRRFHPHITLARMRNPDRNRLDRYLIENASLFLPPFAADGFTLFESFLGSEGAIYEPIAEFGMVEPVTVV
ncbi:RNA 2',3'-cyclic phosphodiesterase [Minwuia sp.]|uniref:RNA 2',3'-cyclic phosphodiesterase n=1 Tax=Minwuia sp. TaxID=2493630 RepID=UPI003A93C3F3